MGTWGHRKKSSSSICFSQKRNNQKPKIMSGNKIDMALDDIIKTNKPAKKTPAQGGGGAKVGKGGAKRASNNNQKNGQKNNQRNNANKNMKKSKPQNNQQKSSSSPAKKQSRAGLRPRTAPGKAKTTFARAKAPLAPKKKATGAAPMKNKSVSQKLAIKRLNKARETLQKAVRAVNDANKTMARSRSRTVARFKSGAMCAVAMSPLKLAIAGHLVAERAVSTSSATR